MYYVGKLFSNVKGLYNEINPATLTGAIDVVVVRHKDGTYTTSPWHVRFGKMGVIRTREKVVDIEINGNPADLHMKLGEAGEAFFVQETDDTCEVPAYLATSPIMPSLTEMEAGIAALKAAASTTLEEPMTPVVEHCGTVITFEDGKVVVSGIRPPSLCDEDDRHYFSDSDVTPGNILSSRRRRLNESVGTQTNLTSNDIGGISSDRPSTKTVEWYTELLSDNPLCDPPPTMACSLPPTSVAASTSRLLRNRLKLPPSNMLQSEGVGQSARVVEDCQFEMDLSDEERSASPVQLASLDCVPGSSDLSMLSRCISMPAMHPPTDGYDDIVDNWAMRQCATTTMGQYAADMTPTSSSFDSRPMSPLSDSEVLNANRDATSQTHLTGDRIAIEWRWGEFPESSSARCLSLPAQTASQSTPIMKQLSKVDESVILISEVEEENICAVEITETKSETSIDQQTNASTVAVSVTTQCDLVESSLAASAPEPKKSNTKKANQTLAEKGIYLDDLSQDEPEIAALYLYNHKRNATPPQTVASVMKDEDSESGRGASLPQSPVTVETDCLESMVSRSPKILTPLNVALSLCGPLEHEDAVISEDRFNQSLITYDVLIENPNITSDPNLVIRVDGRFYNWAVAGPMLLSSSVFKKPLTEHIPKKKKVPTATLR